jgi:hypothetical protein
MSRSSQLDAPPAGARSGNLTVSLDGARPIKGLVGDVLKKPHRSSSASKATRMATGDAVHCEILGREQGTSHMTGGIPKHGHTWAEHPRQTGVVPGYCGHIAGKVAENIHGGTFGSENERSIRACPMRDMRRTLSAPDHLATYMEGKWDSRALKASSRVPGYMGHIPGKQSETVHGNTFGEANDMAQTLRNCNPHVSCEGWMQPGSWPADRKATYKFAGRTTRCDFMSHFTHEQEMDSYHSNTKLGSTFGLKTPKKNPHAPGDRYMHIFNPPQKKSHIDPTKMQAAGCSTYSPKLDGQRWMLHNALALSNGNQRTAY